MTITIPSALASALATTQQNHDVPEPPRTLRAARLLCLDTFARVEETHRPGDRLPLEARADIAQAAIHTAEVATAAAEFAFRAAGAHAVHRDTRIQRCLRDMLTGRQSAAMCDEVWERVGQVRLGRASDDIML